MTPLETIRHRGFEPWVIDDGENLAVPTKDGSIIEFAKEHKSDIIIELLTEMKQMDSELDIMSEPVFDDPRWFVAMTTAPRRFCTLKHTLHQVRNAGWEPFVFAEPDSTVTNARTIWNDQKRGAWHNFKYAMEYAVNSERPFIIMLQDDIDLHPDAKMFADIEAPSRKGILSLYTSRKYAYKKMPGIVRVRTRSWWGATAFMLSRETAKRLLQTKTFRKWLGAMPRSRSKQVMQKRRDNPTVICNIDTAVGKALNELKLPIESVVPSVVQHMSRCSTLNHGGLGGARQAHTVAVRDMPLLWQVDAPSYDVPRKLFEKPVQYDPLNVVMVTSLSPKRVARQTQCIGRWRNLGVKRVIAVQLESEVDKIEQLFPDVEFRVTDRCNPTYGLPLITDIAKVSKDLDAPIIYSNSDIEPLCTQEYFKENWVNLGGKVLQWGQRYDYRDNLRITGRCPGIDVFRITPDMDIDGGELLCVGMVAWDYWLPYIISRQGYHIRTDGQPIFFHREHEERHWDQENFYPHSKAVAKRVGLTRRQLDDFAQKTKLDSELEAKTREREKKQETEIEYPQYANKIPDWKAGFLKTNYEPDLEIVTCMYNITGVMKDNYYKWLDFLGPMAKNVSCYEMLFEGQNQKIRGSRLIHAGEQHHLWQQEALLNIGFQNATKPYVAWLDPDILFENPTWANEAVRLLRGDLNVVHLFETLLLLDSRGVVEATRVSAVRCWNKYKSVAGHPGAAWAARTEVMREVGGLFSRMPLGGGDTMWIALSNDDPLFYRYCGWQARSEYEKWQEKCRKHVNSDTMGNVASRAFHLWHTTSERRQYGIRGEILSKHDFDPWVDVEIDSQGLLIWATQKEELHREAAAFFERRDHPHIVGT